MIQPIIDGDIGDGTTGEELSEGSENENSGGITDAASDIAKWTGTLIAAGLLAAVGLITAIFLFWLAVTIYIIVEIIAAIVVLSMAHTPEAMHMP